MWDDMIADFRKQGDLPDLFISCYKKMCVFKKAFPSDPESFHLTISNLCFVNGNVPQIETALQKTAMIEWNCRCLDKQNSVIHHGNNYNYLTRGG